MEDTAPLTVRLVVYMLVSPFQAHRLIHPMMGELEVMARYINTTTGAATERFGFKGTDLGYFALTNHGYCMSVFGDTFDNPMPGGSGWRSPVILRQSNRDLANGLKWDNAVGGTRAKQVVDYTHHSAAVANTKPYAPFTVIPNDIAHLPDGTYIMSTFVVRSWERQGPYSWVTWGNKFYTSIGLHGEKWAPATFADLDHGKAPMQFNNDPAQGWRCFQNASLVMHPDGYLYMFGTESGRKDGGGIFLARVKWENWRHLFKWEFWGWTGTQWQWGTKTPTAIITPTLKDRPIGEINAQLIDGVVVLAYVDYGVGAVTRTATHPASVWTDPQVHATQADTPNLYAPSVHPYSTLAEPYAHISQWHKTFYGCKFYQLAPLRDPRPVEPGTEDGTAEGTNLQLCRPVGDLTAAELADILTADTTVNSMDLAVELTKRLTE